MRAALEYRREQPADYFRVVTWLLDLERPELARPILDELTKLQLTDAQRVDLVAEFGSGSMLKLARAKELAPAGAEFAEACMAAAAAAGNDPKRLAALVAQLTGGDAETRQLARNDLAATGQPGAIAILEALAKEPQRDRREILLHAAAHMRPFVIGPLLAMLETNDAALRADVADLLRHLEVQQAAPLIAADAASAERALMAAIERHRRGTPPFAIDEADRVELWHWDDATKKLMSANYPAEDALKIWLARLAGKLVKLRPENQQYSRQALVLELEVAALIPARTTATRGARSPANEQLRSMEARLLNTVLADALAANYARAAVAAADELGNRRDASVLFTSDAKLSPLADALAHPDRHVRFAALRAVMAIDPTSPYPGSSRVPDALAWFAGGTGERRAVVAMPTLAAATNVAGMLAAHGLVADATNRGRDAVDLAHDMADLEALFIDANIIVPDVRQVLYELRTHATTAKIPIALMATEGRLDAASKLTAEHERVVAVSRPHSPEVLARIAERLSAVADGDTTPPEERASQGAQARRWLDELTAKNRSFYTIRRTARTNTP